MVVLTAAQAKVQPGRVATEGDELYYEVRGQGQPLLMVPAASWSFSRAIMALTWICRSNGPLLCGMFYTRLKD